MFENSGTTLKYININKTLIRCDLVKYYHEINGCLEVVMIDGEKLLFPDVTLEEIAVALRD